MNHDQMDITLQCMRNTFQMLLVFPGINIHIVENTVGCMWPRPCPQLRSRTIVVRPLSARGDLELGVPAMGQVYQVQSRKRNMAEGGTGLDACGWRVWPTLVEEGQALRAVVAQGLKGTNALTC
jgi:hypothetical protein